MLILALESSAKAASVALCRDGVLIAQSQQCSGLTHSCTLLPMAEQMLKNTDTRLADVDAIAVARGPGSFTGVRIGVSTAKGLAWGAQKPAIGVSTLEAMAYHGLAAGEGALVCAAMDARRSQIYNALFEIRGGKPVRLCGDRAISLAELGEELGKMQKSAFLVGDGAQLCYNTCLWPWPPSGRRRPRRRNCSRSICACRRPSGNARHGWLLRRRKNEKLNQQRRRRDE